MFAEFIDRPTLRTVRAYSGLRYWYQWRSLFSLRWPMTWRAWFVELQLAYWTLILVVLLWPPGP